MGIPGWPEADKIHKDFGRYLLGDWKNSLLGAIFVDLGWLDLATRRNVQALRFWKHLTNLEDSRLLKKAYLQERMEDKTNSWSNNIKKLLFRYGLNAGWYHNSSPLTTGEWNIKINKLLRNLFLER